VKTSGEVSTCFNFHVREQLCDRGAHSQDTQYLSPREAVITTAGAGVGVSYIELAE
jgi:hypothetical protein